MTSLTPARKTRVVRMRLGQLPSRRASTSAVCSLKPDPLCGNDESDGKDLTPRMGEAAGTSKLAIREQLSRILQSKTFIQSDKLSRFLRFVVEHVLDGDPSCLKEYVIGVDVYDRKPPYHPSQDSIVRTEARRLRGKLKEYYETEGNKDLVYVYLRPGSYVPVFHLRNDLIGIRNNHYPEVASSAKASSIAIAVLPFKDVSENLVSATFARGIVDELGYALMKTYACTVISPPPTLIGVQGHGYGDLMRRLGAKIAYEGSVRAHGMHLRITAKIVDDTGAQLWLNRIDVEADSERYFATEEQIASLLSAGLSTLVRLGSTLLSDSE